MMASLAVMTGIQLLPVLEFSKEFWKRTVQTEIFWPWYTLIGAVVTITVATLYDRFFGGTGPQASGGRPRLP
jgi:hypothetical protein